MLFGGDRFDDLSRVGQSRQAAVGAQTRKEPVVVSLSPAESIPPGGESPARDDHQVEVFGVESIGLFVSQFGFRFGDSKVVARQKLSESLK